MTACTVLGGPFALAMQGLLLFITCSVLVYKKQREAESRSWLEFGLDSSKQLMGAGWLHVANMLCAIVFAGESVDVDECTWYATNILVDTTLGVLVEWLLLRGVQQCLEGLDMTALAKTMDSGSYYDDDGRFRFNWYALQLALWLAIVTLMKLSMVALMRGLPAIVLTVRAVLAGMEGTPQFKLFVVMVCIPVCMNTLQFVLTDNFIKKRGAQQKLKSPPVEMNARCQESVAMKGGRDLEQVYGHT